MPEFTHLHVASSYSLRYGTATPAALAARAASLGMPALALTDRDGLYGAFKHIQACADAGIRALLGADLALSSPGGTTAPQHGGHLPPIPPGRTPRCAPDGETGHRIGRTSPGGTLPGNPYMTERVTLLAAGRRGWASLCRLVSAAHAASARDATSATRAADDDVPAVTAELIAEHAAGLVVLLGPASDVGRAVAARRPDLARHALARWRHLGVDTAVEIVDHLGHGSTFRAARLAELARDTRTPAVLTNAVRYLDPVDSLTAQVLDAARHLVPLGSPRLVPHNGRAYLASQEDMAATARRVAAAMSGPGTASAATVLLGETEELARRCVLDPVLDLGVGTHHLPETPGAGAQRPDVQRPGVPSTAYDQHRELRMRCEHAIRQGRYRTASAASRPRGVSRLRAAQTARERLDHELDIIARTGMAGYFLTVADVTDRIRQAGIRCAIRGSGAGSFVNHLLGISAIDPLEHDLLMERFLSPIRNTLPDIDLDVESARRLDAYRIIFDRYGKERTACVCMMETYRARSAIRDVAAAMSLPPDEIGAIAKAFPHIRAKHITAALTELPELRRTRLSGAQLETVFGLAQQLDGLPRHVAMHPCGVLLSDKTLLDRTAVQQSAEGFPLSQLDKDDAEIAGVIKLDVLGVRMQSAMAHALAEIERTENERIDIDAMPRDDEATYAMIQRSETLGCFQIESPGQRELVKKLAPRDVADLIVDISLFRPGPVNSDMVGPFLRTRHGLAEPRYPHEKLEEALAETGGVVVFHEQVLRIIDVMTGCGLAEADLVRRHLSAEGGPERTAPWFRARALARGFDPVTVERVWQVVAAFGGFGFCKAHAAAFAIPVYQSAWLRRHHPAAFYAGVLTHDPGMYPKRVIIADARLHGIEILPVDINASAADWKTETPSSRTSAASSLPPHFPSGGPAADSPGRSRSGPSSARKAGTAPADVPRDSWLAVPSGSPAASPADVGQAPEASMPGRSPGRERSEPVGQASRSLARRLLEASGPLQALRLPGRRPAAPAASPQAIRCPLREVKGISEAEIDRVVAGQPYTSLRDFWSRARVSRPVAERLVLIGAFDSLYTAPAPPGTVSHPAAVSYPGTVSRPGAVSHPTGPPNLRVLPHSPLAPSLPAPPPAGPQSPVPPDPVAGQRGDEHLALSSAPRPSRTPRPSRRDLLARVGVLARQSSPARPGAPALDLFAGADAGAVGAEAGDGMADLVPAGQLRDLDLTERVQAELEILGFEVSRHVLDFYAGLLAGLGVVRSTELADREDGETILVAGVKVATQTPAVRSGQRIIFASLDDAAGLVDLAFFESVQDRCAARLFGSWLLLVRGRVRRAGAGPMAVTVNGYECWDLPALEEIRAAGGIDAVRAAMAAGDIGPGAPMARFTAGASSASPGLTGFDAVYLDSFTAAPDYAAAMTATSPAPSGDLSADPRNRRSPDPGNRPVPAAEAAEAAAADDPDAPARPVVFGNGFVLSPYAETGAPGSNLKHPPRTLWHASPGSTATPN